MVRVQYVRVHGYQREKLSFTTSYVELIPDRGGGRGGKGNSITDGERIMRIEATGRGRSCHLKSNTFSVTTPPSHLINAALVTRVGIDQPDRSVHQKSPFTNAGRGASLAKTINRRQRLGVLWAPRYSVDTLQYVAAARNAVGIRQAAP